MWRWGPASARRAPIGPRVTRSYTCGAQHDRGGREGGRRSRGARLCRLHHVSWSPPLETGSGETSPPVAQAQTQLPSGRVTAGVSCIVNTHDRRQARSNLLGISKICSTRHIVHAYMGEMTDQDRPQYSYGLLLKYT